ncbi:hypothetical protein H4R34_001458 [Dimargaris verticillata]|uniref:Condensation domain-containing protein n=1 Tax=Dimargaris verticillata TaxID=2761393 RepID=A0A9W8B9U9_9FUNG|nr:hypothetical protein H4R34_001458 [Dimargaris verticillata]
MRDTDFAPLTDHLRQKLPHCLAWHTLMALAQFPTTVNGKVNKRALADLDLNSTTHCSLVADSAILDTATALDTSSDNAFAGQEAVLRQAWAELFDVPIERIARQAHFFQLGRLDRSHSAGVQVPPAGLPTGRAHRLRAPCVGSFLLKLNPRVDANAIQDALQQTIHTAEATHDDFCWAECHTTETELSQHLAKPHTQLSLTQGPLLGALLVHLNDLPDQPRLCLVSHHIVIDLVSWRILLEDLNTLLSHQSLPPKTLSFAKWATSLDAYAATLTTACWPEQVVPTNVTALIPVGQVGTRHSIFQTLDTTITDQLVAHACPALRVTPRDAILGAYALVYCQTLGTAQVNRCMEGHGREPWSPDLDIS